MNMEARVAVLETIAAQTSATLLEIKQELREFRSEFRRIHDRDFRITFGAIITTTVGLAALIAHVAHWL